MGQTWREYVISNPRHAEIYLITKRLIGVEMFPISISARYSLLFYRARDGAMVQRGASLEGGLNKRVG